MTIDHGTGGVFAIAPTPFTPDGAIDDASIDQMVEFYARCGCDGITVLGVMGEAPKLDAEEAIAIAIRVVRRAAPRPVIVGVSAPGFASMRALARAALDAGAAAAMVAPPSSLRSDDAIVGYYRQVADALGPDATLVVQDYPLVTGVSMTPGVIARIVADNPAIAMLKHEDWPGLEKISALRALQHEGAMRPISILCGNGGLFLDFECERGADGAMTGYAFPDMLVALVRLARAGERDRAHDLFDLHLPLLRYEQQLGVGLAVRKYVLMRRGAIGSDAQRAPRSALSAAARAEIDYLLERVVSKGALPL